MRQLIDPSTPSKLIIDCEEHISYKFDGFEYDFAEIRINHPNLKCYHDICLEEYEIETTYDLYITVLRVILLNFTDVVYTRGL